MGINLGQTPMKAVYWGQTAVKSVFFGSHQVWGGEEPAPTIGWLCFTAEQTNSTVSLNKSGSPGAISLETSIDGSAWADYGWNGDTGNKITLANVGDKVYFRAKTENQTIGSSSSDNYLFELDGRVAASGNIQTLLKADGSRTDAPAYCYRQLFKQSGALTTAPELPATTLGNECYMKMFQDCPNLTAAPALPATTLADTCYYEMFYNCTSLASAPELPATTLASGCYRFMFENCYSLTSAPVLSATTLASSCYSDMFLNCTALTTAPKLPATTLANYCYFNMFSGCSSLSSVEVAFTNWFGADNPTGNWLKNVAASGEFACPSTLPDIRDVSKIPEGWTKTDAA